WAIYKEYLEKVAKNQRYLASEEVSDPDSPAPKPAKATKPKATKQSKPLAPKAASVIKLAAAEAPQAHASQPPKPTPATTEPSKKDQSKKRVPDKEPVYGDEQVALDLLTLQTPKKKSPAEQYIFQRHTPAPTEPPGHAESPSLYAELGLTDSEMEFDEEVPPVIKSGVQDEVRAGPNPGVQNEGQAGSNPSDDAESQPQLSIVAHAGPNLEHMDLEATDASTQHNPEQMDEEFTTTAYLNVQDNLKLPTEDQFLVEKSQEDEPEKTNTESEVQSMVTVPIHQDTSSVPLMNTLVIDLLVSQPVFTTSQAPLPTSTETVTAITTTISLPPPPPQPQQGSSYSILIQRIGELEQHMADLVQANLALEERMDKQGSILYKLENLDIPH
ncbi:hypothetical protein Tco_0538655, partial [Tanacetum coccineum]